MEAAAVSVRRREGEEGELGGEIGARRHSDYEL